MLGDYVDLKSLEIFNTPYKIKLKGYIETQYQGVNVYILETHGKIYGLELNDNHEDYILHDELDTPEDFDFILKISNKYFYADIPFIIDNDPFLLDTFTSNVFKIEKTPDIKYDKTLTAIHVCVDKAIMCDSIKKELEECTKRELKNKIFNTKEINQPTLEDVINTYKSTSISEESEDIISSMETRAKLPTLEELVNNMRRIGLKNEQIEYLSETFKKYTKDER